MSDDKRYIEVIITPCRWNGEQFQLCGNRVHESKHKSQGEALRTAMALRGKNLSVIIRPSFIETDKSGVKSYREWRSFDGSQFKEVRFFCNGSGSTSKQVPDAEMALPWVADLRDPNPHGLPMWSLTSIMLVKDEHGDAWWFECDTKEGATILIGEVWGADQVREAQVHVSGIGHETRQYGGEAAANRVAWLRGVWKALCTEAGLNPEEEHWFVLGPETSER